jgi:uncharacterized SAM-binding protein YcdF (DUF218 family)
MIGYMMIWVIVLLFLVGFLILFSITLIRVGLEKWRERRAAAAQGTQNPPA